MGIASSILSLCARRVQRQDARELAVLVLQRLDGVRLPVQAVLHQVLAHAACDTKDAALCTEICYGTLRTEIRLNWILTRFLKKPAKLPPHMRRVLLVAVYALLFLEMMPEHAIVDWAVESVKRVHGPTLARVANACLRAVCREDAAPLDYDYYHAAGQDEMERQSVYYSLPLWIVRLWHAGYGPAKTALLLVKSATRPAAGLRLNRLRTGWEELARQLENSGGLRLAPACFAVPPEKRAQLEERCSLSVLLAEGRLSRQSAASQLALDALEPGTWPDPVWDACAGQGTKSCALLEFGKDVYLACDTHLPRLRRIAGECQRLRLPAPLVIQASALRPPLRRKARVILLDVPCSGLGVLASRPDIRRHRKTEHVREVLHLQAAMLETAYAELTCGGHIAYISCAQNPAENEEQIRTFLNRHPTAVLSHEWNSPVENELVEGMYAALLVKRYGD